MFSQKPNLFRAFIIAKYMTLAWASDGVFSASFRRVKKNEKHIKRDDENFIRLGDYLAVLCFLSFEFVRLWQCQHL